MRKEEMDEIGKGMACKGSAMDERAKQQRVSFWGREGRDKKIYLKDWIFCFGKDKKIRKEGEEVEHCTVKETLREGRGTL